MENTQYKIPLSLIWKARNNLPLTLVHRGILANIEHVYEYRIIEHYCPHSNIIELLTAYLSLPLSVQVNGHIILTYDEIMHIFTTVGMNLTDTNYIITHYSVKDWISVYNDIISK